MPVWIHCCGQTSRGYVLLLYFPILHSTPSSLSLTSPLGALPHEEDKVAQEVDWLREQRPGMVQQQSQLELIYSLLESAFLE